MNYIGKSPKARRWKALRIVYDELLPNNQPIRAVDLKAKAKGHISASTLTKRLKELEDNLLVERIVDPTTSPPSVFYVKKSLPNVGFFQKAEWSDSVMEFVEFLKPVSLSQFPSLPFRGYGFIGRHVSERDRFYPM